MSFNEFCSTFRVTPLERDKLAWHLGAFRARQTYEKLKDPPA